jgi:transposase
MRGLGPALLMPAKDPKRDALRQQGVLHPRPGDVTDPRFAANSFFDPRDLVQVKYEMLRRVQAEGYSITEAAAAFGFSRPSFYQAQAAFAQEGLAGLVPRKRGPKQAHKLTEEVLGFLRETQQQGLRVRTGDLVRLIQQRFGTTLHPRSITRALSRHQKKLH